MVYGQQVKPGTVKTHPVRGARGANLADDCKRVQEGPNALVAHVED